MSGWVCLSHYVTDIPKHHLDSLFHDIPGSKGAFSELRQSDRRMLDFYTKLGCFRPITMDGFPQDVVAMGTSL